MTTSPTIAPLPAPQVAVAFDLARRLGHRWATAIWCGEIPAEWASLDALRAEVEEIDSASVTAPEVDDDDIAHTSTHGSIAYTVTPSGAVCASAGPGVLAPGPDGWDTRGAHRPLILTREPGSPWCIVDRGLAALNADEIVRTVGAAAHLTGWTGERIAGHLDAARLPWARHEAARWAAEVAWLEAADHYATSTPVVEIIQRRGVAPTAP